MNRYDSTSPLSSEVVRGCHLCKLYFVWYGRNAYHSTWASKYVIDAAFHKSLPHAKQYAESQRVQGSRFYIREIAALAFPITDVSLIVTQINTVKPFERYHRRNPKSSQVSDIAAFFIPWESDTILQFLVPGDIAVPFLPLRHFYSISDGIYYELRWGQLDPSTSAPEIKFAEATANQLNKWLTDLKPPSQEEAED